MSDSQQLCTFFLNRLFFGVEVQKVQEVIRYQEMTRVPLAPPVVRGLINLRGQIVVAIDLRARLGMTERLEGTRPMNVVVRTDDGAVSLLVDEIGDVLEISGGAMEKPPATLKGIGLELIAGVHKLKDRLLLVLDTEKTINLSHYGLHAA